MDVQLAYLGPATRLGFHHWLSLPGSAVRHSEGTAFFDVAAQTQSALLTLPEHIILAPELAGAYDLHAELITAEGSVLDTHVGLTAVTVDSPQPNVNVGIISNPQELSPEARHLIESYGYSWGSIGGVGVLFDQSGTYQVDLVGVINSLRGRIPEDDWLRLFTAPL